MIKKTEDLGKVELVERVRELEKDLIREKESARKVKKIFISRVNREIRTPLNSVVGFAHLLINDKIDKDKRKLYIQYLNSSTDALLTRIENLIDYAMLTAGQLELTEEEGVRLDLLFDELYEAFSMEKYLQEKYSLTLILSRKKGFEKIVANCDRRRLKQMIAGLLKNALQGTREGSIEFGYKPVDNQRIRFFVSDSADQYRTEYIQRLFKNPGELEKSRQDLDINLSIIRDLVSLMKGDIDIVAHPGGKGNTIGFVLPFKYRLFPPDEFSKGDDDKEQKQGGYRKK